MRSLLYLSADGLLEPLGFSQVARVLVGLASRGWRYTVLSLEKERDLTDAARVSRVREFLQRSGHRWVPLKYDSAGTARAAVQNEVTLYRAGLDAIGAGRATAVHARSYHGAMVALALKVSTGTPYLFDTRSYWFDERLEEGRWLTSPLRIGFARGLEHQLYLQAAGIVTLTELHANDVRSDRFGEMGERPVRCITTTADFDDFRPRGSHERPDVPPEVQQRLADKLVIGIVGSINRSYLIDESLHLAKRLLDADVAAHLLVLSGQGHEYSRRLAALGVDLSRVVIARATHDAMPQWLSMIHWGLLLLQPNSPAKRASMPTKLGEFLATGVRPVHFGCNTEVSHWVRHTASGLTLDNVDADALNKAAIQIIQAEPTPAILRNARERARPHFSLSSAIDSYDEVLNSTFHTTR